MAEDLKKSGDISSETELKGIVDELLATHHKNRSKDNEKISFWSRLFGNRDREQTADEIVARLYEHYGKLFIFTQTNLDGFDEKDKQTSNTDSESATDIAELGNKLSVRNEEITPDKNESQCLSINSVAYRLAATDLFVEKALDFLKTRAERYRQRGELSYFFGFLGVVGAVAIALHSLDFKPDDIVAHTANSAAAAPAVTTAPAPAPTSTPGGIAAPPQDNTINLSSTTIAWMRFGAHFLGTFSCYALLLLFSVNSWRIGNALLDQSEKLYEKRHAMRQGRLYVHLRGGNLEIHELEQAFSWNVSNPNAFSELRMDAKGPLDPVVADIIKTIPEILRAARDQPGKS